ncbi:MAG TPA: 4Fe-4S dicluster domain-containing protein [Candidatus Brocadiia bacterium]|nr:4Fe-4S dicluster domain-containing protein [Candidatus Brocadiales bacterium]
MLAYRKTFSGGFFLKNFSGIPKPTIEEVPLPARVIIPLKQGYGSEVPPTVKPLDKVTAGQVIGIRDSSISTPVLASVNGTVEQFIKIKYLNNEVYAIVIKSDGSKGWTKIEVASPKFESKKPDEIGKILYTAGVTSLGPSGFPTRYNTSSAKVENITDLIINAVNTEPFLPTNEILLKGNPETSSGQAIERFVTGVRILRQALPKANVHIGINRQDNEIIIKLINAAKGRGTQAGLGSWLHIYPLKPKYPQEHEAVLTNTILSRVVPYGGHAADIGIVVLDVQAVLHAYEAVVEGKPLIERIVTLGGSAYKDNIAVKVRVGTPIEHILAHRIKGDVEKRVILGGIMTGITQSDLSVPITKTTSSIVALEENKKREFLTFLRPGINRHSFSNTFLSAIFPFWKKRSDTNIHGEFRPCIVCTYCTDACPVDMMPHLLSKYVRFGPLEETLKLKLYACIDCGLCTYVCPAKIPLMEDIQAGRRRIVEEGVSV